MKNARFSLWLAAAFLAGGVASWLLTVPPAQAQGGWAYKCIRITPLLEDNLNNLGGQGWELVTAEDGRYCMKRHR